MLTELSPKHVVFESPRNDDPERITYELSGENGPIASIGFTKGGTPRRFEFTREANSAHPAAEMPSAVVRVAACPASRPSDAAPSISGGRPIPCR